VMQECLPWQNANARLLFSLHFLQFLLKSPYFCRHINEM